LLTLVEGNAKPSGGLVGKQPLKENCRSWWYVEFMIVTDGPEGLRQRWKTISKGYMYEESDRSH
jgi:hypothetical protein